MKRTYLTIMSLALTTAITATNGIAQQPSSATAPSPQSQGDLDSQFIYQRAIEAVIWSMPAMSDVFFRESLLRDLGMKPGDVMVFSKPLVARHEAFTANTEVNYSGLAYDLSQGPWVVEIPPSSPEYAIIGEFCDNWQASVTMVGVVGPDAGKGGKYLLIPPGYKEPIPKGYYPVPLEGLRGMLVFRPVFIGKGTMEGAVALGRKTRAYPLADAAAPKPTRVIDGWDKTWHSLPVYDIRWFENLAKFINDEPIRERDKAMVGMLSTLGIEKGKPFKPDEKTTKILNAAARDAYAIMQHGWTTPGRALTAWWPDRQWMNFNPSVLAKMGHGWSFETANAVWSYDRALTPFFWASYMPEKLGSEQMYLVGLRDSEGQMLSGKSNYRFRVPADVPVDKFWSVVVYSQKTKSMVPNALDRAGLDSYEKGKSLTQNPDGTVDIYMGNDKPQGFESNWLPTAGEDFFLLFRLYGPAKSVYEKTWKAPDIERMK